MKTLEEQIKKLEFNSNKEYYTYLNTNIDFLRKDLNYLKSVIAIKYNTTNKKSINNSSVTFLYYIVNRENNGKNTYKSKKELRTIYSQSL